VQASSQHQITDQVAQGRLLERTSVLAGAPRQWHPMQQAGCRLETLAAQRQQGQAVILKNKQHPPGEDPCRQRPEAFPASQLEPNGRLLIPVWAAAYRHLLLLACTGLVRSR